MTTTKVLGLDLGTNSIGWGIIEFDTSDINNSKILHSGVRVFPEGVAKNSSGKEISKNQVRREKRQVRRVYYRRKQAIESLMLELIRKECFPNITKIDGLSNLESSLEHIISYYNLESLDYLKKKFRADYIINSDYLSIFITKIIQHYGLIAKQRSKDNPVFKAISQLKEFFGLNPYELRYIALNNQRPLSKFELGRIFYHFVQRKGFQSSAKNQKETKKEEGFYSQLDDLTKEVNASGFNYYGEYFYYLQKNGEKVRKRPTIRKELIREFNKIWKSQKKNSDFASFLTGEVIDPYEDEKIKSELRTKNKDTWYDRICDKIIYYQRPLKSQKYLVGLCSLERYAVTKEINGKPFLFYIGKTRCPISALAYEEYRMLCEINNIKVLFDGIERKLTEEERAYLIDLYNTKEKFSLSKFAKNKLPAGSIITGVAEKESLPKIKAFEILKSSFGLRWPDDEKKQKKIWWELYFGLVEAKEKTVDEEENSEDKKKPKWSLAAANEKNKWGLQDNSLRIIEEAFPFKGDTNIIGNPTTAQLRELFGTAWEDMPYRRTIEYEKKKNKNGELVYDQRKKDENDKTIYREDVWHDIYYHDKKEWLSSQGKHKWNLNDEQLEKLNKIRLKQGYASLSLNAIEKILVYLRKGYRRDKAVFLANLQNVFKRHLKKINMSWDDFNSKEEIDKAILNILNVEIPREYSRNSVLNKLVTNYYKGSPQIITSIEIIKKISPDFDKLDKEQQEFVMKEIYTIKTIWKENPSDFKKGDYYYKTRKQEDAIKSYLKAKYDFLDQEDLNKLYHPSQIDSYPKSERLGSPRIPGLNNPVVIQALYELRHLVNELVDRKMIDPYKDKVRIEMSRELNDRSKRTAYKEWQKRRRELKEKHRKELKEAFAKEYGGEAENYNPNDYDLLKYFLWKELDSANSGCCPYTGEKICFSKLYGDKATMDIEHIIPYSLSCDDSLENLTISDKYFNREIKKNLIPAQLPNHKDILQRVEKWKKIYLAIGYKLKSLKSEIKRAQNYDVKENKKFGYELSIMDYEYYRNKYDKFVRSINKIDDKFKNRQLPDTGYINRLAVQYLKSVFYDRENENKVKVFSVSAKAVEQFRKIWKLQIEDGKKDRSEHYHHAKDAIIAACLEKGIYDKMARFILQYGENWFKFDFNSKPKFKPPWGKFIFDVNSTVNNIIVSHKQDNKLITVSEKKINEKTIKSVAVRGALHDENYYGKIKNQYNINEKVLVKRKPLNQLSLDELMRIADKGIASIVLSEINKKLDSSEPLFEFNYTNNEEGAKYLSGFSLKKMDKSEKKPLQDKVTKVLTNNNFYISVKNGKNIGKQIPIKSVKIIDSSPEDNFRSIYNAKQEKFVVPGNNLVIGIYGNDFPEKKGKSVINRYFEIMPFIDAVKNNKRKLPENLHNMSLLIKLEYGDYVLAYDEDEKELYYADKESSKYDNKINCIKNISQRLFRVVRFDQNGNFTFERHFKAVKRPEEAPSVDGKIFEGKGEVLRKLYTTFIGFKVEVDRLGNIKPSV